MKYLILILLSFFVIANSSGQSLKKFYKDKLEPRSKLIDYGWNYTIERTIKGTIIYKKYFPETKSITRLITFKSDLLKERDGIFQERWDDGTIVTEGIYRNGIMEGEWLILGREKGLYKNGQREGIWNSYDLDSICYEKKNYLNGVLEGEQFYYNKNGVERGIEYYENGEMISTTIDTTNHVTDRMPRFPGCEESFMEETEISKCASDKMLKFIYSNITYPKSARIKNIEGRAMVRFTIDKDGVISNVTVLSGICEDIKSEVMRLMDTMPNWIPGMQNEKHVKVEFNLPIVFKLE